jgi:hypothetical protein
LKAVGKSPRLPPAGLLASDLSLQEKPARPAPPKGLFLLARDQYCCDDVAWLASTTSTRC